MKRYTDRGLPIIYYSWQSGVIKLANIISKKNENKKAKKDGPKMQKMRQVRH